MRANFDRNSFPLLLIFLFFCSACLSAGTHGAIKKYCYGASASELRAAINNVYKSKSQILQDTILNEVHLIDSGKDKVIIDNRYNDGIEYFSFSVRTLADSAHFTVQVSKIEGIDSNAQSTMSLTYAYTWGGLGGSDAHGLTQLDVQLRGKLLKLFESTFVQRLDSLIGDRRCDITNN